MKTEKLCKFCKFCKWYDQPTNTSGGCGNPRVIGSNSANMYSMVKLEDGFEPLLYAIGYDIEGVGFSSDFGCIMWESRS